MLKIPMALEIGLCPWLIHRLFNQVILPYHIIFSSSIYDMDLTA